MTTNQTMETLLSSAFDLLSSYDPVLIRKGLRHLEGLLAKLCLAPSSVVEKASDPSVPVKKPDDPAFREFIKLQNGFEWNGWRSSLACGKTAVGHIELIGNKLYSDNSADSVIGAVIGEAKQWVKPSEFFGVGN